MAAGESQTALPLSLLSFLPPHFAEHSCHKLLPGVSVVAPQSLVVIPAHEGGDVSAGAGERCMDRLSVYPQASGTGEEAMVSVVCSYDDLSRKLWNLKELPLTVTAVQGIHPALRYTDVSVLGHSHACGSAGSWGVPWSEGGPRE